MSDESAFAAVILYRLSTFYVPPVWGFFTMRWLQRNRDLWRGGTPTRRVWRSARRPARRPVW